MGRRWVPRSVPETSVQDSGVSFSQSKTQIRYSHICELENKAAHERKTEVAKSLEKAQIRMPFIEKVKRIKIEKKLLTIWQVPHTHTPRTKVESVDIQ